MRMRIGRPQFAPVQQFASWSLLADTNGPDALTCTSLATAVRTAPAPVLSAVARQRAASLRAVRAPCGEGMSRGSASEPRVLVVVVNYRTADLVVACLRSLAPEVRDVPGTRVVIVDNDSGDSSVERIENAIVTAGWQPWASVLASPVNGGFAWGNNFAIRAALAAASPPDLFWLLNPDTEVRAGALRAFVEFLGAHPQVGLCGGGIDEGDGQPWPFAFRFPSIGSEIERGFAFGPVSRVLARWSVQRAMGAEPARVDWVPGATLMIRRDVFERVGLMDEHYFLYFEETDYCLQAKRAGLQCWYLPQSRVMHIAGQSTGVTSKGGPPRRTPAYWFESRRRYFVKNHGRAYAAIADVAWMISFALGSLRRWLQRKPADSPPNHFSDFFRHSALLHSRIDRDVRALGAAAATAAVVPAAPTAANP